MLDEHLMESYLDNIAEQVVDEDKIVTYKSLSRRLGIHVNTAKQLLYTYLTNEKAKNSFPISATYLVAGKVVDGSFNITIVNEADLKDAYATFLEITSEHVYSVQKGKSLKEVKVLCGINKEQSNSENSKPVITCSKSLLKSRGGGGAKKKVESFEESNKKAVIQALLQEKPTVPPPDTNVKKVENAPKKESTSRSPKKTSPKGNLQKTQEKGQKPSGSIANMFAKAAQKNAGKPSTVGKPDKSVSQPKEEPKVVEVVMDAEGERTETRNLEKGNDSKEGLKRKKMGNKRKRIQMLSDSEESDSNDDDEEEKADMEVEDSPPCNINMEEEEEEQEEEERKKEETKEFIPRNKRKKRKVIDRTVMNEDGYLETKKEVVFETDSENEEMPKAAAAAGGGGGGRVKEPQKPKVESVGKGVQGAGVAKKQSSLLNFFKKG